MPDMTHAVLLIEDETILAKNIGIYLQRHGFEVRTTETAEEGLAALESYQPDAVVLDFNLPGMDGMQALKLLRRTDPGLPVLMLTGHGSVEMAVEAMKLGARDFLTKPVSLSKLKFLLDRAMLETRRDSALAYFQQRAGTGTELPGLIGESPPMRQLRATVQQLIAAEIQMQPATPPAVLLLGETGTGKEVVARALHFGGVRQDKPLVELNCAALPAQLLESELFGHERGAFTGAAQRKLGLVETAEGGTLFLDEIGDMDLALQAKLLKLLEDKTMRRVGGLRELKVDVRVVAATHRPLEELVRQGLFRADLYFRLCVVRLPLAPLRERGDDVLLLARHFMTQLAQCYGRALPVLSASAQAKLYAHDWPGNVRELRNVLEQAMLLCPTDVIADTHLALVRLDGVQPPAPPKVRPADPPASPPPGAAPVSRSHASTARPVAHAPLYPPPADADVDTDAERMALVQALEGCGWNVSRTALALSISRDALRYRIDKYGLQRRMTFSPRSKA